MSLHNIIIPKRSNHSHNNNTNDIESIDKTLCRKYFCIPDIRAEQKLKTLKKHKNTTKKSKKQ